MAIDPLTSVFDLGKSVIERIWPDANKRAEEMRKLEELRQQGNLAELNAHVQLMLGQIEVNKNEALHKSLFVAGWRPFIGWVGGIALAYQFIFYPLLTWVWVFAQSNKWISSALEYPPILEVSALMTLIIGMLGIGSMRSFDKVKGVDTKRIP